MKKKFLTTLGIIALLGGSLVSCGDGESLVQPTLSVSIENKEELLQEWHYGDKADTNRYVELKLTSTVLGISTELNATEYINSKQLQLVSNNDRCILASGKYLICNGRGYADISVILNDKVVDTLNYHVLDEKEVTLTPIADAIEICKGINSGNSAATYTCKGMITSIASAYSSSYGNISFWMADLNDSSKQLEAYRCVVDGKTGPKLVPGTIVTVTGFLTRYGSTYEFASGCTISSYALPTPTYEVTVAEAMKAGLGLPEGVETSAYYKITGVFKSVVKTYGNRTQVTFTMTDRVDSTKVMTVQQSTGSNDGDISAETFALMVEGNIVTVTGKLTMKNGAVATAPRACIQSIKEPIDWLDTIDFTKGTGEGTSNVEWDDTHAIFAQNGITVTSNKAASTTANNYSGYQTATHYRCYAHSDLKIEYSKKDITLVKITCIAASGSNSAQKFAAELISPESTYAVDGKDVIITLSQASKTLDITNLTSQIRITSIAVGVMV